MTLPAIYSMLPTGEYWKHIVLFKVDMPAELREKQEQKTINQAIRFLEARGKTVS